MVAALLAIVGIPWLVHSKGPEAVTGWRGMVSTSLTVRVLADTVALALPPNVKG